MSSAPSGLSEQEQRRREEREALERRGIDPYPHAWDVDAHADEILDTFDDDLHQPEDGEGGAIRSPSPAASRGFG